MAHSRTSRPLRSTTRSPTRSSRTFLVSWSYSNKEGTSPRRVPHRSSLVRHQTVSACSFSRIRLRYSPAAPSLSNLMIKASMLGSEETQLPAAVLTVLASVLQVESRLSWAILAFDPTASHTRHLLPQTSNLAFSKHHLLAYPAARRTEVVNH